MPLFVQEYEQLCLDRDIDFQAQTLIEKIKELYDKHCHKKSKIVSYKSFIKPWLSRDLLNSINYKHLLFKKYKLEIIPFEFYRDYNNSVSKLVKKEEARFQYYRRRLIAFKSDMRQTWRTVNTLFGRSTDKTSNITLLDDNEEDVSDPKSSSNMFCDYFSTIATKLNEKNQQ